MQTNKPDYNCHSLVTRHAHPVDGLTHPMPWEMQTALQNINSICSSNHDKEALAM